MASQRGCPTFIIQYAQLNHLAWFAVSQVRVTRILYCWASASRQGHKGPLGQQACTFPQCFAGPLKGCGRILPISLPRYVLHSVLRRTLLDTPLGGGLMKTHFPLCGRRSTERNLRSCSHDYHFSVWLPKVDCLMKYNLHVLPMSVAMFFDVCQLRWSDNLL